MAIPAKIMKLDETVVNRIAAGEVIQRPANALKELIENSLDAKASNIQIIAKEGGLKLLQIQDNGTGIRKEDMEIVCERFTTSKLQKFEDLKTISTFGFRGEALASISHVALLTITTKTANEKCAYKATYIDSKLKGPPKPCAGNQGTTIMIENLFYNIATRRKALSNPSEEFTKITDVVMKYAVHNSTVGFTLKKHGEASSQIRTVHNSTKINNIRILYGNPVARELLEVELDDDTYKFKMHALITNPNYTSKRMILLLFINNRLVDSSTIRKMLEELYSIYLPKKTHPWCYISLQINPANIDVNVHPTKHEVRFLHEDAIIERMKSALDERLAGNTASRTFYLQARLPKADITQDVLKEVLPEYDKDNKAKKVYQHELVRTDASDQKLDKFNFTVQNVTSNKLQNDISVNKHENLEITTSNLQMKDPISSTVVKSTTVNKVSKDDSSKEENINRKEVEKQSSKEYSNVSTIEHSESKSEPSVNTSKAKEIEEARSASPFDLDAILRIEEELDGNMEDEEDLRPLDEVAEKARKRVYQYFGQHDFTERKEKTDDKTVMVTEMQENNETVPEKDQAGFLEKEDADSQKKSTTETFKSYSVNNFRREVRLTSVLKLRKEVEDNCHKGLRDILSNLIFVGCVDHTSALVQSGVNLYICDTKRLAEELFYEIMLYDFANHGVITFSEPLSLYELALLGLETEEAGWTEEDGKKEELAMSVKEVLLEKADMMKEYFSIVIDKRGFLKSLPILLDKYFPYEGGIPLYILRLATEVEWSTEQPCFQTVCRETARFYSEMNSVHKTHDWKHITEHVLYPAIKESLLPPKHFVHDSTILQIASLPDLYKVFERC